MPRFLAMICAGLLVCVAPAFATSSGPSTHTRTLNVRGIGQQAPAGDVDASNGNACNASDWVDNCPSGDCQCIEFTGVTGSVSGIKGPVTISDFFVTSDQGVNPATEPAVGDSPSPSCNLFLGVLTVITNSGSQSRTINLIGTTCKHVIGVSARNPTGTHDKDLISGGWGISDQPAPNPDTSGWGELVGQLIHSTNALSLKLTGTVTQ